ncbi:MAG: hypothetical protein QF599_06100, partial [Planctomycetota bacterium]|nr:hypothetical protein [Planctomycetota bacterium]
MENPGPDARDGPDTRGRDDQGDTAYDFLASLAPGNGSEAATLMDLSRFAGALRELVSPKMSQEILFRAGRRWGERQAQRDGLVDSPMDLTTRVEQALR